MSRYVKGFFGQKSSESQVSYTKPRQLKGFGSGGAKINIPRSGTAQIRLPGGIAQQRKDAFNRTEGIIGDVQGDIQQLRSLENPFIRARVTPFKDSLQRGLDARERAFSRRGVFGTFRNQDLDRTRREGEREIADQTALAQTEALNAILQRQVFQQSLTQNLREFTQDEVQQAIAELGLIVTGSSVVNQSRLQSSASGTVQGSPTTGIASLFKMFTPGSAPKAGD